MPAAGCWPLPGPTGRCGCGTWPARAPRPGWAARWGTTATAPCTPRRSARTAGGRPLTGPANIVTSVAFSPNGQVLAAGSQDSKVWLWNVRAPARPLPEGSLNGATDWVNAVAFSPDGRAVAAGSSDNSARVWNLAARARPSQLPLQDPFP